MLMQGWANLELLFLRSERYSCGRSIFLLHPTAVQLSTIFSKLGLSVQDRKIVSVSYCFKFKKSIESRDGRCLRYDSVWVETELHSFCYSSPPLVQTDLNIQNKKYWHFSASELSLPGSFSKHLVWIFLSFFALTQNSYSISLAFILLK